MKCKFCGSNLQIEDELCPYCGKPNPHYIKHRQDMQAFQTDYQSTKQEVLAHVSKLNQRTVHITIIAVLVALCAVALVLCFLSNEIRDARIESEIARNRAVYEEQIKSYMEDVNPLSLSEYGRKYKLTYSEEMEEYSKIFSISWYYQYFYNYTVELMTEGVHEKYETLDEKCESLGRFVESIYECRERQSYDKDFHFTPDKTAYMDAIAEKTELLLKAYYGLSDEEIRQIPELSRARLTILLAEGYQHE